MFCLFSWWPWVLFVISVLWTVLLVWLFAASHNNLCFCYINKTNTLPNKTNGGNKGTIFFFFFKYKNNNKRSWPKEITKYNNLILSIIIIIIIATTSVLNSRLECLTSKKSPKLDLRSELFQLTMVCISTKRIDWK